MSENAFTVLLLIAIAASVFAMGVAEYRQTKRHEAIVASLEKRLDAIESVLSP